MRARRRSTSCVRSRRARRWSSSCRWSRCKTELGDVTGKVIVKLRRVTDVTSGVYGKEILPAIGLNGPTSRVPLRLYERGRRSQTLLRGPDLNLRPKAGFVLGAEGEAGAFSPLALADELEPELTDLGLLVDTRFAGDRGPRACGANG